MLIIFLIYHLLLLIDRLRNPPMFYTFSLIVIQKIVKEIYLRDDIGCSSSLCEICPPPSEMSSILSDNPYQSQYIVLDTNTVLHQIDLLEQKSAALSDIIILQTVMEEVRGLDLDKYNRMHALIRDDSTNMILFSNEHRKETHVSRQVGETPNDRNDRAIREATKWYQNHLGDQVKILLISNDKNNRDIAIEEGMACISIHKYIGSVKNEFPGLVDYLAEPTKNIPPSSSNLKNRNSSEINVKDNLKPNALYLEHLSIEKINLGIKTGRLFKSSLRTNRYNWTEASVKVKGFSSDSTHNLRETGNASDRETVVLIRGQYNLNRATEGDIVAIEILPKSHWMLPSDRTLPTGEELDSATKIAQRIQIIESNPKSKPTGRVVGIMKRNWRSYCGSVDIGGNGGHRVMSSRALFVPVDRRIPKIRFRTSQSDSLLDKRFVVAIDQWDIYSKYPSGHYQRTLGKIGERETENEVILIEHNIPAKPFTPEVIACLPPADWEITPLNSRGRVDLRKSHCVVSIDPPGCKDIDDALHGRMLPNGNVEVGVHIADVAYFVLPGSALDIEAANRATSTYLVERRLDMLPGLLTESLCSLRPNEDHFAFSVVWEMDYETAEVVSVQYHRSIIHSRAGMTYGQAQAILDDDSSTGEVAGSVRILAHIARVLRRKRMERGALDLASPEVRFMMDSETHDPLNVEMYQSKEANKVVEEFMLLANCQVAQKITDSFPNHAVLRRHPTPDPAMFEDLVGAAASVGVTLHVDTSKQLADSLNTAVKPEDPYFNKLIRIMATRCMTQAVYFGSGEVIPSEYKHYGLAAEIYTHFTSPIRRYSDVMVHRLLAAAIGISPLPQTYGDKHFIKDVCNNLNQRHLMAQLAGRSSVALNTKLFFAKKEIEVAGLIMKCRSNGIVVLVPKYGLENLIKLVKYTGVGENRKEISDWKYDDDGKVLRHKEKYNLVLRVFKPIKVLISVEEVGFHRKELTLTLKDAGAYDDDKLDFNQNQQPSKKRKLYN